MQTLFWQPWEPQRLHAAPRPGSEQFSGAVEAMEANVANTKPNPAARENITLFIFPLQKNLLEHDLHSAGEDIDDALAK
jgi:hypothetical protein